MATYFHGSNSENQASGGELQTLYLMNPNYLFYPTTSSQNPPPPPPPSSSNMIFLNSSHAPPHMGVIQDPTQSSHLSFNYTPIIDQSNINTTQPQMMIPISPVVGEDGFRRPPLTSQQQGLSLSLSSHQHGFYKSSSSVQMGDDSGQLSVVFSSKYLRAAQELLDEVVNVRKGSDTCGGTTKQEKRKKKETVVGEELSDGGETSDAKRGAELTTVQRQELQMKKAKLINMLDLVEQRYRQYHNQMQIVVASFERASGLGSAKSYTSLALKTISKQFRCLKDTVSAQINGASKALGEDFGGGKGEGSSSSTRLRMIDQQLRQQRALQQLGMMQHNAWRPQRGLPERAVTVLRAWLFEHFLHPYPKDSDKHMLAKQTGLTRSQVSNWFINARVRLWKPMVEEMYLEEIKDQDQNGPGENGSQNNVGGAKKAGGENSTKFEEASEVEEAVQLSNNREKPYLSQNASPPNDDLSSSTLSTSPTGRRQRSIQVHNTFNLIGTTSSDTARVVVHGSPKKVRRTNNMQAVDNSPSSILQMDVHEMHPSENNTKLDMLNRDHVYSLLSSGGGGQNNADTETRFGTSYQQIGRFNSDQIGPPRFHGNGSVSLTLGPPPIENQNYFANQNIHEFGRRLEMGNNGGVADFFSSNNNHSQPSHSPSGFEELGMQSRKRFAAQLLPDYVA